MQAGLDSFVTDFSWLDQRCAGVVLHPTSLPGRESCGTLGTEAFRFVDWLAQSGLKVWQILPLGPTHDDLSPYQCLSAYAGNPRLICFAKLGLEEFSVDQQNTSSLLIQAYQRWHRLQGEQHADYRRFIAFNEYWLEDFVLFVALRAEQHELSWNEWPMELRSRQPQALAMARQRLSEQLDHLRYEQYLFFSQWSELTDYASSKNVLIFGDMPIFVAYDSADVWANQDLFLLDSNGKPSVVAGVPPDYFSETGQRWGNPLYDWPAMVIKNFSWWRQRFAFQFQIFDLVRIDHFRGFEAYWEIDANCETAIVGRWVKAPGEALFSSVLDCLGRLPLVAEDLGVITEEVVELQKQFHLPGMKILQFAFDSGDDNPYLLQNHIENCVVYTGTHDNNTSLGWFNSLDEGAQQRVLSFVENDSKVAMPWSLVELAMSSVARLVMVPMQDLLSLDEDARMNTPGVAEGNWRWRFAWQQVPAELAGDIRHCLERNDRA
ncbi:MAG: 4-alpha-glucanotransferase [Gammaproteobacteria bacterium]|nr:4-alpha-glucanotransferase [Gammaproteobacteria bacterium]